MGFSGGGYGSQYSEDSSNDPDYGGESGNSGSSLTLRDLPSCLLIILSLAGFVSGFVYVCIKHPIWWAYFGVIWIVIWLVRKILF